MINLASVFCKIKSGPTCQKLQIKIGKELVREHLDVLNDFRSPGLDGILPRMLKELVIVISEAKQPKKVNNDLETNLFDISICEYSRVEVLHGQIYMCPSLSELLQGESSETSWLSLRRDAHTSELQ